MEMSQPTARCLRVAGLRVENLRALRDVSWPRDGINWNGAVPGVVVVGGVNGSGKTTLLDLIADSWRIAAVRGGECVWQTSRTVNTFVDLEVRGGGLDEVFRLVAGDADFVQEHGNEHSMCFTRATNWTVQERESASSLKVFRLISQNADEPTRNDVPSLVYLPSDRALVIPPEQLKAAGKLRSQEEFFYRFRPPEKWLDANNIEAVLYAARWQDLNAKEEGKTERNFEAYAEAFAAFFSGKTLEWIKGELLVRIGATGETHDLSALSSGEKQVVILVAELLRRWRPGSLILIDEPESHMHPTWLAQLWRLLLKWQRERGAQVIVATQSPQLFGLAEPGTTMLLGNERLG